MSGQEQNIRGPSNSPPPLRLSDQNQSYWTMCLRLFIRGLQLKTMSELDNLKNASFQQAAQKVWSRSSSHALILLDNMEGVEDSTSKTPAQPIIPMKKASNELLPLS
ncbi:hypothetical protein RCL_jg17541.t1 [Rhizophagus clarus]|uniref:Uncharacterized protein n=1 Tax=Rhizophagus clarus TaxID=94130 RepID=A0A8H3KYH2_9GLOM|nr:hypothetical protein RCL_jg17541.t1 [Rhizophagus clarus]